MLQKYCLGPNKRYDTHLQDQKVSFWLVTKSRHSNIKKSDIDQDPNSLYHQHQAYFYHFDRNMISIYFVS